MTPPETESEAGSSSGGARSEDGDEIAETEIPGKAEGEADEASLKMGPPTTEASVLDREQDKEQSGKETSKDQDFISEALDAIELD